MDTFFYLGSIGFALIASAFFSGSEIALLRLGPEHFEKEKKRTPSWVAAKELTRSSSRLLVTILLGNNVVNIFGAACASAVAVYHLGNELGLVVATISMTVIVLIFSEILPKAVAARNPAKFADWVSLPLYIFHKLLTPVHKLFNLVIDPFVERVAGSGEEFDRDTWEDILRLAGRVKAEKFQGAAGPILGSAARAEKQVVENIMTPRTDVVAFSDGIVAEDLLEKMLAERYTRIPIYSKTIDTVSGFVHFKDVVTQFRKGEKDIKPIIKPVLRVPERKLIFPLLAEMQQSLIHMAIVKDEHGGTLGLVTHEDILEELVGEIRDEFDREELTSIQKTTEGTYKAFGRVSVQDFNRETGSEIPAHPGETLSGLVFNSLGRVPSIGDSVNVKDYEIHVVDMSGHRISAVLIKRQEKGKHSGAN